MLEHFFGSKTRVKLLQIFFRAPERNFFARELARQAGIQLHAVRREIANLVKLGVLMASLDSEVGEREIGQERAKFYRLNSDSLILPEIRALLLKSELLEEKELIADLAGKGGKIKLFLLTGVFTHDNSAETDLLLVGALKPVSIARLIKQYETRLGKAIRFTLLTEREFKERREIGDKFLFNLFEAKHISVVNEYGIS